MLHSKFNFLRSWSARVRSYGPQTRIANKPKIPKEKGVHKVDANFRFFMGS